MEGFVSPVASPFLIGFDTLPQHWISSQEITASASIRPASLPNPVPKMIHNSSPSGSCRMCERPRV